MADMRRFALIDLLLLLAVLAVAAGARVGYLMTCADGSRNSGPLRVQDARPPISDFVPEEEMMGTTRPSDLEALIHNVRKYDWFGCLAPFASREEATAHTSPGYPYLVGLLGKVVEEDQLKSTVRWSQVGLGSLTAVFYFLFARRAFRNLLVGTLAGLFAALHPFWIVNVAQIDDGTLASFALGGCLLLASQAGEKGGALLSLLLGLSLAGLALVRAPLLPFSFVTLIWFLLRSRSLPRGWLCALCAFLGFANGLAPWTVRNFQTFNEPVPVASSAYLHLWVGNNEKATGGPANEKMWPLALGSDLRQVPNQPMRYARLGQDVAEEMRDRPVQTVRRRMLAFLMFFLGEKGLKDGTFVEYSPGEEEVPAWLEEAYPMTFQAVLVGMLALALLGWRWSYGWRWSCVPAVLAAIWVPLPYILSHAESLSGPRLPLDGVLLSFAAVALVGLIPGLSPRLLEGEKSGPATERQQP